VSGDPGTEDPGAPGEVLCGGFIEMGAVTVGPLPPWLDPACGGPSPPSGAFLPWAFPILSGFPEGPAACPAA